MVVLGVTEAMLGAAQSKEKELGDLIAAAWNRGVRLELRSQGAIATPAATEEPAGPPVEEHPLVKEAMELFRARVVGVQRRKPAPPS